MLGDDILVAPVYTSMKRNGGWWRKGIYLPAGDWYDLNDGRRVKGGRWLTAYPVDLTKIPVFVRANAVIPLYDEALTTTALDKTRITFDVWPGACGTWQGSCTTYEDDGTTRAYQDGAYVRYSVQGMSSCAGSCSENVLGDWKVTVRPMYDSRAYGYEGMPEHRLFEFAIHLQTQEAPAALVMEGRELARLTSTNDVRTLFANVRQG